MVIQEILQRKQVPWWWGVWWLAFGIWQQPVERYFEADTLTTTLEVAEVLTIDYSMVIQHSKQIGKVKKLNKWDPHCIDRKSKKSLQQQWTISWLDYDVW